MSAEASQEKVRVGLLGVGLMGSAMAHRLLDQGIAVIAWDRNAEHVRDLDGRGGEPAETPSDVVQGAGVVITMLPTAAVILDLVEPLLEDWPEDTDLVADEQRGGGRGRPADAGSRGTRGQARRCACARAAPIPPRRGS